MIQFGGLQDIGEKIGFGEILEITLARLEKWGRI